MLLLRHQNFVNNVNQFYQPLISIIVRHKKGEKLIYAYVYEHCFTNTVCNIQKDVQPLQDVNT